MGQARKEDLILNPIQNVDNFPNPRIELMSPELAGRFFTTVLPGKAREKSYNNSKGGGSPRGWVRV